MRARAQGALIMLCVSLSISCSEGGEDNPNGSGGNAGNSGSGGGSSGSSSGYATQVPVTDSLAETTDGALAGDAAFAVEFCGDVNVPSTLKPVGTVVRVQVSQRYFMCTGDFGADSAELIQTNIASDPVQGFIPYAALFMYEDATHPNTARPVKGASNFALLVINLLNDEANSSANSACGGSNDIFRGIRVGGATENLCDGVPTPFREDGTAKFVDVTFPGGQQQSFELEPVPFVPPG